MLIATLNRLKLLVIVYLLLLLAIACGPTWVGDPVTPTPEVTPTSVTTGSPRSEPTPTATPTPTTAPTPTPTFEEIRNQALRVSYDEVFRNNEQHIGDTVYYKGRVDQINQRGADKYLLRVNVTERSYGIWEDDVRLDYQGKRLLEDDIIEFVARVEGLWTYTTVLGAERTIPHLSTLELRLVGDAAASPSPTPATASPGSATSVPPPTPTPTPTPEPTPTPQPINLAGTGQQASTKFHLNQGLAIFRMTHTGRSNFYIRLLDDLGRRVDTLVNEIGPFDGSKAIHVSQPGTYLLDISADGGWNTVVEQPAPLAELEPPISLSGQSQQASRFFKLDSGLAIFRMTHDGQSNFYVCLLDNAGNRIESLVNEIGHFDGSKAVGIEKAGIYLLNINADGHWTVKIEQ